MMKPEYRSMIYRVLWLILSNFIVYAELRVQLDWDMLYGPKSLKK